MLAFPPSTTCLNSSKLKDQQWNPCYLLEEGDLKVTLPFRVGSQWRCTSSIKRSASGGKFRNWVPKMDPILKCRRSFEGHLRGQIYKEIVPAHLELQTYTRRERGNNSGITSVALDPQRYGALGCGHFQSHIEFWPLDWNWNCLIM